jgi:hypothetical protein
LASIIPLTEEEPQRKHPLDPVLEAECYVLLAQVFAARNDYTAARSYLDRWQLLSRFVDNYYLHHLAERIVTAKIPLELDYEFPIHEKEGDGIPDIAQRLENFAQWMINSVRERRPAFKGEQEGTAFGLSRSQFGRRFGARGKDLSS